MPPIRICKVCFKNFETLLPSSICGACFNKLHFIYKTVYLEGVKGLALYEYNDFFRSLLYQLKGCYDIELKDVFLERVKIIFHMQFHSYFLLKVPSWIGDDEERGFNHLDVIFESLKLPSLNCVKKKYKFKQSNLKKKERELIEDKLEIIRGSDLTNKNILIVDDVMTTGSSLKAMIKLIKPYRPHKIAFLVLARNCRKIEK